MVPMAKLLKFQFLGSEMMTGLPEYRNGGLLVDTGLLTLKKKDYDEGITAYKMNAEYEETPSAEVVPLFEPADDVIVEWRAVTVGFLDELLVEVNKGLGLTGKEALSLAQMLEAGTWKVSPFAPPVLSCLCAPLLRASGVPPSDTGTSIPPFGPLQMLIVDREGVRLRQLKDHKRKAHQSRLSPMEQSFDCI
jgi:hypothetical protein